MEDQSKSRKERLAALRAGAPLTEIGAGSVNIIETLVYETPGQSTAEETVQQVVQPSVSIFAGDLTLEKQVAMMLQEAKTLESLTTEQKGGGDAGEVTLEELAPKKANWDLKQDYERRTAALQRDFDRACVELIRTIQFLQPV
jgi:hypothetical protein